MHRSDMALAFGLGMFAAAFLGVVTEPSTWAVSAVEWAAALGGVVAGSAAVLAIWANYHLSARREHYERASVIDSLWPTLTTYVSKLSFNSVHYALSISESVEYQNEQNIPGNVFLDAGIYLIADTEDEILLHSGKIGNFGEETAALLLSIRRLYRDTIRSRLVRIQNGEIDECSYIAANANVRMACVITVYATMTQIMICSDVGRPMGITTSPYLRDLARLAGLDEHADMEDLGQLFLLIAAELEIAPTSEVLLAVKRGDAF